VCSGMRTMVIGFWVASVILLILGLLLGGLWIGVATQAEKDEAQRADVIVILGSAVWPGGRPSPSLEARVRHGISLYRRGIASYLIFSGGVGRWPPAEAEVMRRMALDEGIPEEAILLDVESRSTFQSIQKVRSMMRERGWSTAVIVSDPFHLWRALMMARDEGIQAWGSPALDSPTYTIRRLRYYYTLREVIAILWYRLGKLF